MWDDPWQENWFWVSGRGRNSKSAEWKQVVAWEKTEFEMKIIQGKKKVKWAKKREGQNMWIEIHYSIKSSDLICTNLLDKKWILKSYAGKKIISNNEEDHSGFLLGSLWCLPLFLSFWICLWWCQILIPSDLRQPVGYFQGSADRGCLLQLLIWSLCTQQPHLSTIGRGWIPSDVGAIFLPQAASARREVVSLSKMVDVYEGWLSTGIPAAIPKASIPSLSSSL